MVRADNAFSRPGFAFDAWEQYLVPPGSPITLSQLPTAAPRAASKKLARSLLKDYRRQIDALLRLLAAQASRSLLVVLQGVDASGKDGLIRRLLTGVNPQFCRVVSFKEPGGEELRHDYLWRIYHSLPEKGQLGIFNRSQYEDVLVPYARGSLTFEKAQLRLQQIAAIERIWTENEISIVKFLLHIGRDEQARRFRARLSKPEKQWKVKESDFADRGRWPQFQGIYQQTLQQTSTSYAPWFVIPADRKWYRDLAVAAIVLSQLKALNPTPPMPSLDPAHYKL